MLMIMQTKSLSKLKGKFTKDMLVMDIIQEHPDVATVLMGYGLHCVGCHFSDIDTLESGARIHGMDDETINMMVKDVNAMIEKMEK